MFGTKIEVGSVNKKHQTLDICRICEADEVLCLRYFVVGWHSVLLFVPFTNHWVDLPGSKLMTSKVFSPFLSKCACILALIFTFFILGSCLVKFEV